MRKFEKFFLRGAGYTLLILSLYYLFAIIASPTNAFVSGGRFLLILVFGFITALAEFIYSIFTVKFWLKALLHYAILLATFILIFIPLLGIESNGPASVIAWVVIFSVLYALCCVAVHFIKKGINKVDDAIETKKRSATEQTEYTSMFGRDD